MRAMGLGDAAAVCASAAVGAYTAFRQLASTLQDASALCENFSKFVPGNNCDVCEVLEPVYNWTPVLVVCALVGSLISYAIGRLTAGDTAPPTNVAELQGRRRVLRRVDDSAAVDASFSRIFN